MPESSPDEFDVKVELIEANGRPVSSSRVSAQFVVNAISISGTGSLSASNTMRLTDEVPPADNGSVPTSISPSLNVVPAPQSNASVPPLQIPICNPATPTSN